MQTINIDISDLGRIIIDDHVYYPENNGIDGMFQNPTTNEKIMLKPYTDEAAIDAIEAFEWDVLAMEGGRRGLKNIIYPRIIKQNSVLDEWARYYAFAEIPHFSGSSIYKLSDALMAENFSIYSRVMTAINLAESLNVVHNYVGKSILSIHPEDIYVNTDNGDIYIWIERWLSKIVDTDAVDDFGFAPEWYSREKKAVTEADFRFFMAYAVFRLLCNSEPFDGDETLMQFPLLTDDAVRFIHSGSFGFVLSQGDNCISTYMGRELQEKWRALPGFLRSVMKKNFTIGIENPDERTEISQWLKTMQQLRDCLVFVNGRFRFCDPDSSNPVLFMKIDDYKIPVWPKKAIYWYHVDIPVNESKNGIVAGVTSRDGHCSLKNLSGNVWGITLDKTSFWVYPEQEVEITEGMTIQLENKKIIKVVNGLINNSPKTVTGQNTQNNQQDAIKETDVAITDLEGDVG